MNFINHMNNNVKKIMLKNNVRKISGRVQKNKKFSLKSNF